MEITEKVITEVKLTIERFEERRDTAKRMLENEKNRVGLFSHNYIVAFPFTLWSVKTKPHKTNPNLRVPCINNDVVAPKWTKSGGLDVCAKMENGRGEHPVLMSGVEYYSKVVEMLEECIASTKRVFKIQ